MAALLDQLSAQLLDQLGSPLCDQDGCPSAPTDPDTGHGGSGVYQGEWSPRARREKRLRDALRREIAADDAEVMMVVREFLRALGRRK